MQDSGVNVSTKGSNIMTRPAVHPLLLTLVIIFSLTLPGRAAAQTDTSQAILTLQLPAILAAARVVRPMPLTTVSYWGYQIQDINVPGAVELLAASRYDMLVLEPTRTDWSSSDKDFDTRAMVSGLKNRKAHDNIHRKLILAYIDIGEAEDWRWYWTWSTDWNCTGSPPADWPAYILACDPDGWGGNYPVAFWDQDWKNIIIYGIGSDPANRDYTSVIDEVIRDGFDGIYLDWVEAFEDTDVMAAASAAGKDPAVEMIAFIQEMRAYARLRNPNFIIIQQNAASLIDGHPELAAVIDGIAQEAIWYDGDADVDWDDVAGHDFVNDQALINYYLNYLDDYQTAGLPVFDCEYALSNSDTAYTNALNNQFVPYVSRRALSRLTTTEPPGY
jgi:cysteinyl-tRNA synthetase